MPTRLLLGAIVFSMAASNIVCAQEYLVRFHDSSRQQSFLQRNGGSLEVVSVAGQLYKWVSQSNAAPVVDANVVYVQPNFAINLPENPSIVANRAGLLRALEDKPGMPDVAPKFTDNPDIQEAPIQAAGSDPLLDKAWGIGMVGADLAWKATPQGKEIVVAVTDTGVDYNHKDLIVNMWRNKGETPGDGEDNDNNGFIDDVVGWDFSSNDNKPYDLSMGLLEILLMGGNPGHGTHVAGVIGASLNNGQGIAGVAPLVKIMAVRFISEKGQGTTEAAVKAVDYAVMNGAHIINASWGGEAGQEDDKALKDAIERAEKKGVIFVAAAGNGRLDQKAQKAIGFDNDTDAKPIVPASYKNSNIVTVAAIDSKEQLAEFSNFGAKSVKIAAPGVKILSTVPGDRYQDTVVDIGPMKATWDGTSMASPFVAGALAVIWSTSEAQKADDVIKTLLTHATPVKALEGKVSTGGRLELKGIK